jgi:CRP/FNR family cyclic AMP-dependent transcriptional regulator
MAAHAVAVGRRYNGTANTGVSNFATANYNVSTSSPTARTSAENTTQLPAAVTNALESVSLTNSYPTGAILFAEGQACRGVFVIRRGKVKVSVCSREGKTLILRIAEVGEMLGVAACISSREYEATATALGPCEITFIRRCDLHRLMRVHPELALYVTQHLSQDYTSTCREIRDLMLSDSASEKLARLLMGWLDQNADSQHPGQMKMSLTHEEIGQMIGSSRETVTRLLAGFRRQHLIQQNGSTLVVPNRMALESLIPA